MVMHYISDAHTSALGLDESHEQMKTNKRGGVDAIIAGGNKVAAINMYAQSANGTACTQSTLFTKLHSLKG